MSLRILDFADGFDSSSSPTETTFSANGILFTNASSSIISDPTNLSWNSVSAILKVIGEVGIGIAAPLAKMHIQTSASSAGAPSVNADELVIENNGACGMSIYSSASSTGNIFFGDPVAQDVGRIVYNHPTNTMSLFTNSLERVTVDSAGNVGIGVAPPLALLHLEKALDTNTILKMDATGVGENTFRAEIDETATTTAILHISPIWSGNIVGSLKFLTGTNSGTKLGGQISVNLKDVSGADQQVLFIDEDGDWVIGDLANDSIHDIRSPTATSAVAGGNGDVPAQVEGYWVVKIKGTERKIPFYRTS